MAKQALTAVGVKNARPGAKRREIADHTPGLHLVVQPGGARSWALRFRGKDGKPVKLTLGPADVTGRENPKEPNFSDALTLGQARRLAIRVNDERLTGIDVVARYRAEARKRATVAAAMKRGAGVGAVADGDDLHRRCSRVLRLLQNQARHPPASVARRRQAARPALAFG